MNTKKRPKRTNPNPGHAMNQSAEEGDYSRTNRKAFSRLLSLCDDLRFVPQDIGRQIDQRGHYDLQLDREFPFHISLFHCSSRRHTPTWNWHERLEVILPLDGPTRMVMGEQTVEVAAGDLLVVDNMKLHRIEDFPGFNTRLVVLTFMPGFIYTPGSPSCDYAYLLPFYAKREGHPHILRRREEMAAPLYLATAELMERYFYGQEQLHYQSGCKASFLQILYYLTRRFQRAEVMRSEFVQHRQQVERLARLFEFVRDNYAERITITQATQIVHMSQAQFTKVFKKVSGMTFVAYLTRVRITNALRLLREPGLTIAEIAAKTGFSDQSYFDRRFRQAFGKSPREWRRRPDHGPTLNQAHLAEAPSRSNGSSTP